MEAAVAIVDGRRFVNDGLEDRSGMIAVRKRTLSGERDSVARWIKNPGTHP